MTKIDSSFNIFFDFPLSLSQCTLVWFFAESSEIQLQTSWWQVTVKIFSMYPINKGRFFSRHTNCCVLFLFKFRIQRSLYILSSCFLGILESRTHTCFSCVCVCVCLSWHCCFWRTQVSCFTEYLLIWFGCLFPCVWIQVESCW